MTHAHHHPHHAAGSGAGVRDGARRGLPGLARSRRPAKVPAGMRAAINPCKRAIAAI